MAHQPTGLSPTIEALERSRVDFDKAEVEGSIKDRFEKQVQAHADRIAIKEGDRSYTYRELNEAANKLANSLLAARGDEPGRVGLLFETSASAVIAHIGALKAGKTCYALDPNFPVARLSSIYEDAETEVVATTAAHLDLARELGSALTFDIHALDPATPTTNPDVEIKPDRLAAIVYTSGSTGRPKGVMQPHRTLLHRVWTDTHYSQITKEDRQSLLFSLTFGAGFPDALAAVLNGATLYPFNLRRHDLMELAQWLEEEEVTIFTPPVAAFRQFHQVCPANKRFPKCRIVILAGEASYRPEVEGFRRLFDQEHCTLVNLLGASEAQIISRYRIHPDTPIHGRTVPIGYADADKHLRIVDSEDRDVEDGQVGEIVVTSRYLAVGYWRRPELMEAAFTLNADGTITYRTRDLVTRASDGCMDHRGRSDFVVKIRGYRIEIVEVEAALVALDAVRAAAVAAREVRPGQKQLIAYVVLNAGAEATARDVRESLAVQLPDYMVPARIVFLADLPRTMNGKVDRKALAELTDDETEQPRTSQLTPRTITLASEIERRFLEVWQNVLGIDEIGVDDNFFDLGGDSLSMVRLATELKLVTGRDFPIPSLLQTPTVAELVRSVQSGSKPITLVTLGPVAGRTVSRRPLFCVFGLYLYKHLAEALGPDIPTHGIFVESETEFLNPDLITKHKFLSQRSSVLRLPSVEELAQTYIREIRRVQPTGPYQLIGSSFGGVVAFEIAGQLRAAGEQVHLVALLDSFAKGFRKPKSLRGWASHIRDEVLRVLPRRMPTRESGASEWDKLRKCVREEADRKYQPQPYDGDVLLFRAEQRVPFPGYAVDSNLGWNAWVNGRLVVEDVPGDHLGILAPPNVSVLADKLRAHLDQSEYVAPAT